MGGTSSPDPPTPPFKAGMRRLVLQLASRLRGTLGGCCPLLTLPMGGTSSPDPKTAPFEFGMRRPVLQLGTLSRGMQAWCGPLLTLPMGATSSPDPTRSEERRVVKERRFRWAPYH